MFQMKSVAFVMMCVGALLGGCASPIESGIEQTEGASQPIIGGKPADAYTEAALIDMGFSLCSGAVIAPRVVLTAGHCVGGNSFSVRTPYANNQSARGRQKWTPYVAAGNQVNPETLDVGIIILDTPINLPKYPTLSRTAQPDGTRAINVGRVRDGEASFSSLFYGQEVTLKDATQDGFPLAYISAQSAQPGDSGGPVYVGTGDDRKIVAVTSGGDEEEHLQIVSRLERAFDKIQELIAANGGGGAPPPPVESPSAVVNQ